MRPWGTHRTITRTFGVAEALAVCRRYEDAYEMSTRDFYQRYRTGEFAGQGAFSWALAFEILEELIADQPLRNEPVRSLEYV